jgi:hypothetical protein
MLLHASNAIGQEVNAKITQYRSKFMSRQQNTGKNRDRPKCENKFFNGSVEMFSSKTNKSKLYS